MRLVLFITNQQTNIPKELFERVTGKATVSAVVMLAAQHGCILIGDAMQIVRLATFAVCQQFVGLLDFDELFLGIWLIGFVRMPLLMSMM